MSIDRAALTAALHEMVEAVDEVYEPWSMVKLEDFVDRILALVRPVEDRWAEGFAKGYHAAAPVPPLPTEPYTVIRIHHTNSAFDGDVVTLGEHGWGLVGSDETPGTSPRFASGITGFEVLSEPHIVRTYLMEEQRQALRRETAMAVLDRVRECWTGDERINDIAREFGVDQ